MKKPYLNLEERLSIKNDTLQGAILLFNLELEKFKRLCYRKYYIFGYLVYYYNVKKRILNPINAAIKRNWKRNEIK